MFGKGITDVRRFIERMLATIREFMEDDGQAFAYQRFIASASGSVTFAKSLNRSVTGSMNDLIKFAKHWLSEDDLPPHDVGFKLTDTMLSALATTETPGYGKPNEAFKAMLGSHSAIDGDK